MTRPSIDEPEFFLLEKAGPRFHERDAAAAMHFASHRAILAPAAIEPHLLSMLMAWCDRSTWTLNTHPLGACLTEKSPRVARAIELLIGGPTMLRWLETVIGCSPLASVTGRIAQTQPMPDHHLPWHNDLNEPGRILAITINLGNAPYEGGVFELRDASNKEILFTHVHRRPGDVVIFEVDKRSQHRVTPMTSGGPRRIFTGWFLAPLPAAASSG